MKQNLLSQFETYRQISKEYDSTKEANIQIGILREIAIRGKQTKPQLVKSLGHTYRKIAITLSRDENKNIKKNLFCRNGSISKKNIDQSQHSLTNRAMIILMLGHYKNTVENKKQKIVGKPYLNLDEFLNFVSRFEKEHAYTEITKKIGKFRHPLQPLMLLYLTSNQSVVNLLISRFKDNKKLQKYGSLIISNEFQLQQIKKKIEVEKYELNKLLSNMLIPS